MTLNAPTKFVFLITLVIAIIAVVAALGVLTMIPVPAFWIMTAAYVLLFLSCLISGL